MPKKLSKAPKVPKPKIARVKRKRPQGKGKVSGKKIEGVVKRERPSEPSIAPVKEKLTKRQSYGIF